MLWPQVWTALLRVPYHDCIDIIYRFAILWCPNEWSRATKSLYWSFELEQFEQFCMHVMPNTVYYIVYQFFFFQTVFYMGFCIHLPYCYISIYQYWEIFSLKCDFIYITQAQVQPHIWSWTIFHHLRHVLFFYEFIGSRVLISQTTKSICVPLFLIKHVTPGMPWCGIAVPHPGTDWSSIYIMVNTTSL